MEDICLKRYSCRKFKKERVPAALLEKIFRAAMQAPSARDERPWEFILVREKERKNLISEISMNFRSSAEADCLIVLLADSARIKKDSPWWVQDMSACAENILLQAAELGLGCVWQGVYPREDRMAALKRLLAIPEQVIPFAVIAVGYPAFSEECREAGSRFEEQRIYAEQYGQRQERE